jgi:hypothetical protein
LFSVVVVVVVVSRFASPMMASRCLAERQAGSRKNVDQISCKPAANMTPQTLQHRSTISEPAFSSELACATFQAQNSENSFETNF